MAGQTSYYGKLLRPEIDGGKKVIIVCGQARFKSSANVCTIGVPFSHGLHTSSSILGFSYGWRTSAGAYGKGKHLQTSGIIHASAVTMSAALGDMGAGITYAANIRVSRLTGISSAAGFWYKVIGW
jgi:hypothetical protein